jgi:hypothetical protein
MPVHHRLRLLTFPMRTSRLCSLWPDMRSLRFRRVPFGRDVAFGPRRSDGISRSDAAHIAFDGSERLDLRNIISFVAQSPTPSNHCVRFASAVADDYATLASRRRATTLPGPGSGASQVRSSHHLLTGAGEPLSTAMRIASRWAAPVWPSHSGPSVFSTPGRRMRPMCSATPCAPVPLRRADTGRAGGAGREGRGTLPAFRPMPVPECRSRRIGSSGDGFRSLLLA